jgi:hypothetical protein
MDYNIDSDVDRIFWGVREYEGLKFYIEPNSEKHPLCPFSYPSKILDCPHSGLCEETYKKWKKIKFIEDDSLGYKKLEKLIPKGLTIKPNLTFINADFLPPSQKIKNLLNLTNAVPLMIYGLKLRHDYDYIFNLARSSEIRPVYISGSSAIPVPKDFK